MFHPQTFSIGEMEKQFSSIITFLKLTGHNKNEREKIPRVKYVKYNTLTE